MDLTQAQKKWTEHPFYKSQIVVGIDVGIEGIGLCIRKGPEIIFARTYIVPLPEAAPLAGRRLKRAMRRSRTSARHRDHLYKGWCKEFGLPVVDGDAKARTDAWKLRYRAATQGVSSPEAVSVCLRHTLSRRGFSYHRDSDASYPWGEEMDYSPIRKWLSSAVFDRTYANELLWKLQDLDWMAEASNSPKREGIMQAIDLAVTSFEKGPLLSHIAKHLECPVHRRPKAWNMDFPRDLIEQHTSEIITRHAQFFKGREKEALAAFLKILNYSRNKPGATAARKIKKCPYLSKLDDSHEGKILCSAASDLAVRRFNLVEFLAQRQFNDVDGFKQRANAQVFQKLDEHLAADAQAITARATRPKLGMKELKSLFISAHGTKLEKDDEGINGYYFDQLKDLVTAKMSSLAGRANMSSKAAQLLLTNALANGWVGIDLKTTLADFFMWRRDVDKGFGLYPQVEFLLGRLSKKGVQAVPGILRREFERLAPLLGQDRPDVVIAESIRSVARHADERKDREREMIQRRKDRETLFTKHGLEDGGTDQDRRRVMLYEAQKGLCPYTGKALGSALNTQLQVDHIFPRERGGVSEMHNLVLTFSDVNRLKSKRTPFEARSDFPDYSKIAPTLKWGTKKLELFLRKEANIPDWRNLTRTSQLAKELREEVARWLGIKGDADKVRARIGAPSGLQTAICRRSKTWRAKLPEVEGKKDRTNQRHHLWDAVVLSHIPPSEGTQPVAFGGIFYQEREDKLGDLGWQALDLGPDLLKFERQTADQCLVIKKRQRKSKKSRTEETIYGKNEEGRLTVRKPLIDGQGVPHKSAQKWLDQSGIPADLLPKKRIEKFLEQEEDAKPLELLNGTQVNSVRTIAPKESPVTMLPHRNREGDVIGWKIMQSPYARMEIWLAPELDKKGKPIFQRRFVPSERGLASLHRLAKEGKGPWWKQKQGPDLPSLRREVIGKPLAKYSKKFTSIQLGDLLLIPFNGLAEAITPEWDSKTNKFNAKGAEHWVWHRVVSINSSGQVGTVFDQKPSDENINPVEPASVSSIAAFKFFADQKLAKR